MSDHVPQNQFTFIHDVILESVTCGDTQITSADLRPSIQKMSNRNPQTGKTGFELQFEVMINVLSVLCSISLFHSDTSTGDTETH